MAAAEKADDVYRAICREFPFGITGTHSWAHSASSYRPSRLYTAEIG